ncbi:MAG: GIY-YIG nuclease family protein [Almyronema sp.]
MTFQTSIPALADLNAIAYLDESGQIPEQFQGKVGIYAIFDSDHRLQYVGYSRDVALSLKQHLMRQPLACYWLKVKTIDRPNRTILESIRDAWIAENGQTPVGNDADADRWNQPVDAKLTMTAAEKQQFAETDELGQIKLLKQVARRVEADILDLLKQRGVQMDLRFNPKLKEQGLLDLK